MKVVAESASAERRTDVNLIYLHLRPSLTAELPKIYLKTIRPVPKHLYRFS
jgi:hypothetical protein